MTQPEEQASRTSARGRFSRRALLVASAVGGLAVGGAVGVPRLREVAGDKAVVSAPGPDLLAGAMVGAPLDERDVDRWRSDIDTLAKYGQTLLRTGIYAWKVAPEKDRWDSAAASFYTEQFEYARNAGLAINLVLPGAPDWAQAYGFDEYVAACTWIWGQMRQTFGAQVALWQPFNEADEAHYQHFTPATRDAAYLSEFSQLLGLAKKTLGTNGAPVTTNLTGWPLNDEREDEWYTVLDAIAEQLDVISIDLYPADQEHEIALLAERVQRVKQRYGKSVFVAELGLQTAAGSWTEPEQQRYVPAAIDQLRTTELWGICLYELRDTEVQPGFGIKRADGTHKEGFDDVMRSLGSR